MSEHAERLRYRIAARVMAQSCECCEKREFDFYLNETFVCESCAAVA